MRDKNAEKMVSELIRLLRAERQKQGISCQKLGEMSGIHRTTISLIEREIQNPTMLVCKKLANALEISLGDLVKKAEKL